MAGAGFKTFTAGDVFTATDANTYLMQQAVMVFTNEAARDAAITSPSEGMHAYLTAPTTPSATGENTYIPTGITTIYNGSVWVCVTPVGAMTSNSGTTTSTSYTATLSGTPGTNPSVTVVTGTSAMISIRAYLDNNTVGSASVQSVAVSGATTRAADGAYAIFMSKATSSAQEAGTTFILPGLTAGTNTFTLQYRATANTATFGTRGINVVGIA